MGNKLLNGKVVVILGGAGFLGEDFAKIMCEHGAMTIIADVNKARGKEIVMALGKKHGCDMINFMEIDITDKKSLQKLIRKTTKKYNKIDAVINTAYPKNKNFGNKLEEVEYEDFCEISNIHMGGYFISSQQFGIYFQKQGYGNIINVSSIYGVMAPRFEIYHGTKMTNALEMGMIKAGIIHMTKFLAKYYKQQKIRVNCISPGGILDGQPESFLEKYNAFCANKGMLNKRDVSGTVLFLVSDLSNYITGQNIIVDDGFVL